MTLSERQQELIEDLNHIQDAHERLAALSSYSKHVALPEDLKAETMLVPGCVSRVWVDGGMLADGTMTFRCDADSPMVKHLVSLLCHLYSGALPTEIVSVEPTVWQGCGFHKMLSPTRLNGLAAVRSRIRTLAELHA